MIIRKKKEIKTDYFSNYSFYRSCCFLGFLSPIAVLGYQLMGYFKVGTWNEISIIDVLIFFKSNWAIYPTDWVGIWKILDHINPSIPLSMSFFIIGVCFLGSKE